MQRMKFVIATKHGGSVIVPLTGIATEGEEYLVREKDGEIILTPSAKAKTVLDNLSSGG